LGALLQKIPLTDANGNNPLDAFGKMVATIGALVPSSDSLTSTDSADGGQLLADLFRLLAGGDASASDDESSNPLLSILSSLGDSFTDGTNPLLAVLPSVDSVTAADGASVLGSIVGKVASAIGAASGSTTNPLTGFVEAASSLVAGASERDSNPLDFLVGLVGKLSA
jgi:hypothetical protein